MVGSWFTAFLVRSFFLTDPLGFGVIAHRNEVQMTLTSVTELYPICTQVLRHNCWTSAKHVKKGEHFRYWDPFGYRATSPVLLATNTFDDGGYVTVVNEVVDTTGQLCDVCRVAITATTAKLMFLPHDHVLFYCPDCYSWLLNITNLRQGFIEV